MKAYVVSDKYSDHVYGVGLCLSVAQWIEENCGGDCFISEVIVGEINWEGE